MSGMFEKIFFSLLATFLVDMFFKSMMTKKARAHEIIYLAPLSIAVGVITVVLALMSLVPILAVLSAVGFVVVMAFIMYRWCYSGRDGKQFALFVC